MESAKALASWKKNKPITLQNTGVSDILRKLPKDMTNTAVNTKELLDVAKKINAKSADKNIKKQKKAAACLATIKKEIEDTVKYIQKTRIDAAGKVNDINSIATKYTNLLKSGKVSPQSTGAYNASKVPQLRKELNIITSAGRDGGIIPSNIQSALGNRFDAMRKLSLLMTEVIEDSTKEKPKFDTKTDFKKYFQGFVKTANELPPLIKQLKSLP